MVQDFLQHHWLLLAEFGEVLLVLAIIIVVAGILIARFDGISNEDGIYFAFVTALTIGFGDLVPRSRGARIVSILLAVIGLIMIGIVVAVSVHALDLALGPA